MRLIDSDELKRQVKGLPMMSKQRIIDPVHVAGGCYCRECKYFIEASDWPIPIGGRNTQCIKVQSTRKPDDFCSEGKKKEPD